MTRKIFIILLLTFVFCIGYVYATDINLDLPTEDTNNINAENTNTNETVENAEQNTTNETTENIEEITNQEDAELTIDNYESETLSPSNISSAPEDGLSITNIINILLITVGIIIILLAFAIFIRLKN